MENGTVLKTLDLKDIISYTQISSAMGMDLGNPEYSPVPVSRESLGKDASCTDIWRAGLTEAMADHPEAGALMVKIQNLKPLTAAEFKTIDMLLAGTIQ